MQTILGAGGAIGTELAKALKPFADKIQLVSRHPQKVNSTDHIYAADLTDFYHVDEALRDTSIAYLTVGLPYSTKIWEHTWPKIMQNVVEACIQHGTRLVFFDNIYMYQPESMGHITEETPIQPSSKKGRVRAKIAKMVMDAVEHRSLKAVIARSADFYGPHIDQKSILTESVFKNFKQGKKANWLCSVRYKHSFTYTVDAGKATALLGNTDDAYGQVWHLPTAPDPYTGKEWIEAIAKAMDVSPKYLVAGRGMVRLMGLFNPLMKELVEMLYQYDRDYVFDSSKFTNRFGMEPTPYEEGIKQIVQKEFS